MYTPERVPIPTGLILLFTVFFLLTGCGEFPDRSGIYVAKGRKVEIVGQEGNYTLLRNGEPYFIKGAGGYHFFDKVKENGGNSVRVWHTDDAQRVLDEAHKHGLTVTLGLWMAREKEGFNYYDKDMVAQQLEDLRKVVLRYKDHPALLLWGVGNEVNVGATNTKVWDAVNEIAEMIHAVDPDHPTTTMLIGVREKTVNLVIRECPAIDLLSFNIFGGLHDIDEKVKRTEWKGPYIISEFGARGYWETYTTWWYAPLEQTSTEKAAYTRERYQRVVLSDTGRCLGGYVFYWGNKHEGTPTWFSLIARTGEVTESVHVMRELWSGDTTGNKAPSVINLKLDNRFDHENIYLAAGHDFNAVINVKDPEGDSLQYIWEVLPETVDKHGSSIRDTRPPPMPGLLHSASGNSVSMKSPKNEGAYRLFVYVYDGQGNVATANIPFYVNSLGDYTRVK